MLDSWAKITNIFRDKNSFIEYINDQNQKNPEGVFNRYDKQSKNLINTHWELMQLGVKYRPPILEQIKVILFKAAQLDEEFQAVIKNDKNNYWTNYSSNVSTYLTPGNHTTIMEGDGVFMAIEILKQLLNDVIKIG